MKTAQQLRQSKKELESKIKELLVEFINENGEFIIHLRCEQNHVHAQEQVRVRNLSVQINLVV